MPEFASPKKVSQRSNVSSGLLRQKLSTQEHSPKKAASGFGQDFSQIPVTTKKKSSPVIETSLQAFSHYMSGNGVPADIGPLTIDALMNTNEFRSRHQRITTGVSKSPNGNFAVDMTSKVFHIGRTNVDYDVQCKGDQCTVTYTFFRNDGFWDVDFIDERVLGSLGVQRYTPDGKGPNLERMGGTPYPYNTATRKVLFPNPKPAKSKVKRQKKSHAP